MAVWLRVRVQSKKVYLPPIVFIGLGGSGRHVDAAFRILIVNRDKTDKIIYRCQCVFFIQFLVWLIYSLTMSFLQVTFFWCPASNVQIGQGQVRCSSSHSAFVDCCAPPPWLPVPTAGQVAFARGGTSGSYTYCMVKPPVSKTCLFL